MRKTKNISIPICLKYMLQPRNRLKNIAMFYIDGFRRMTVGRSLWALIIIKLIIFFAVLKLFFFPDILSTRYSDDESRADAVRKALSLAQTTDNQTTDKIP